MDLIIRKAVLTDADALTEILTRSWVAAYTGIIPDEAIAEKNSKRSAMWRKTLAGEHNQYIAFCGAIPAGLLGIHPSRDADMPHAGEIGAVYLHPDFIGKGYGRQIMDFAVTELKNRGFSVITLWVLEKNIHARRFYEKCGFRPDGAKKEIVIGIPLTGMRYRMDI
jgi:GNAT superfamily N-acetyltransferase